MISRFCICDGRDMWETEGGRKEELEQGRGKQGLQNQTAIYR